jgi:uncharacterized protein (DUF885 family)
MLLGAAAVGLAPALPAIAQPPSGKAAAVRALYDAFMQENFANSPQFATSLGVDTGALAGLRAKTGDASLEGRARAKALKHSQLVRLQVLGRGGLEGLEASNYDAVLYGLRVGVEANTAFDFGELSARSPYVLSQLTGAYQDTPTFLDTTQPVKTADDAAAYLERLKGFAIVLDQETEVSRHDAGLGVIPPDFILDKTLEQMDALIAQGPDASIMITSLAAKLKKAGLPDGAVAQAASIYDGAVRPALARQREQVKAMRAKAISAAGVGARPQGEAYYAAALRGYTTAAVTPFEVHQIGLEQTRQYQDRIDAILRAQGLTQGTVGARIAALSTDPRYLYPDTDAGKVDLIAHLNDLVKQITPRLPAMFHNPPTVPLEIHRVPPYIEAGAPLGYYDSASLDGTRPAIYYINLAHTADWPRWLVSSVTFHEGVPGHHLQISTAQHIPGMPLIRRTGGYSGYAEGWALYAEQLADELGMYDQDPLGRVGYLKSELWRACRMVLDTGVHLMGWTRQQAIRWKMDNDGSLESGAANEVERYCVWPGQAPSYKIGHTVINRLRTEAKARLGARFDIKDFHDAVLNSGSLPLEVLEGVVARYV